MPYKNNVWFTSHDPKIMNIMEKLVNRPAIKIDTDLAKTLSRYKKIRLLREKNHLFIGWDRDKRISILFRPPNVNLKRKGNGYLWDFF